MSRPLAIVCAVLLASTLSCSSSDGATEPLQSSAPRVSADGSATPEIVGLEPAYSAPGSSESVAVIGVGADEGLPVYALPGTNNPLVGEIPSTADDVIGLGEGFETDDGATWWLVRWERFQGWVVPGLAYLGRTTDVTAQVVEGGAATTATSIDAMALAIAEQFVSVEPASQVTLVASAAVDNAFVGTALVDVIGLGDDSLGGLRLAVTADGSAMDGDEFELTSVLQTLLCSRGVASDSLCI